MARTVAELEAEIARLQAEFNAVQAAARASGDINSPLLNTREELRAQIAQLKRELRTEVAQENSIQPEPPATASQAAQDDAPKGPNAPAAAEVNDSGRIVAPPATTTPTNADTTPTSENNGDRGLDGETRTTEQTQATDGYDQGINVRAEDGTLSNLRKNPETGELYDASGLPGGVDLTTEPGTPTRDDAANNSRTTTTTDVNKAQANPIQVTPQPNILDRYNNYAWSASVYLMSSAQYSKLMNSKDKKIDGYYLLFQSGGAGVSDGIIRAPLPAANGGGGDADAQPGGFYGTATPSSANRSPFFPNDFYIDSVTIEHQTLGKGSGASHLTTDLKFTVVEPQGITLLDRLYDAVANMEPRDSAGKVNYTAATYLMVLRFYGYDESGNIVYPVKGGLDSPVNTSDPAAVVEKFIPFIISNVNWTVGTKTVSYEFEGAPVGLNIGGSSARGSIPYDVQLVDSTVAGLLGGNAKYSTGTAPNANPGASTTTGAGAGAGRGSANDSRRTDTTAAPPATQASVRAVDNAIAAGTPPPSTASAAPTPKKIVTQGLMGAMNDFQQELVRRGTYLIADEYSIEFVGIPGLASAADISDAKIQLPNVKKDHSKSPMQKPPTKDSTALNQQTISVNYENRSWSITAGQQILQVIELVIRNSSYIGKQKLVITDADGTEELNQQTTKNVTWFTISMSCERKGFDDNRNDYAYKIKYTVSPYLVKNLTSQYFPTTKFTGVHKSYPFWFTGQNTAVKEYQETLNTMFRATLSGNGPGTSIAAEVRKKLTSSMPDLVKYAYSPRSDQSNFGADGKELEPNANAAELLYNPSDLASAKVRLIGDPAWIMQGSQFKPVTASTVYPAARTGFEADGSISFDSQDILFEMVWQRPEDYDLNTGLADPYVKQTGPNKKPLQSRVYIATKVTSEFRGGSFEQTLNGSLYLLPLPSGKNAANPAAAASTANASPDTKRTSTGKVNKTTGGPGRLTQAQLAAAQKFAGSGSTLRTGTFDSGAEGNSWDSQAAVAGSQQSPGSGPRQFQNTAGGGYDAMGSFTGDYVSPNPLPAGAPKPPTDGAGGTIGVTEATNTGPPKLTGIIARANAAAAALGNRGRGSQSPGNPANTTNPAVQSINKTDN